ncbi:hypothetical protein BGS_0436 [Beggiatoa sp. SS]|nr:hypothetical protein BGS_0436 [Beggiatoa sp. SS]
MFIRLPIGGIKFRGRGIPLFVVYIPCSYYMIILKESVNVIPVDYTALIKVSFHLKSWGNGVFDRPFGGR